MSKVLTAFKLIMYKPSKFLVLLLEFYGTRLPDKLYLKILYRFKMGRKLNLMKPITFTEKLQWLKLHNRKQEYTTMVDKYSVKDYVKGIIGPEYIIPTLGVWNNFDDIDFSKMPHRFVLKTTHGGGGGGVVLCKDKSSFNLQKAKEVLEKSLNHDIYRNLREWPYKNVERRIIAEEFLEDPTGELKDYKFFCFNGEVKFFKIDFGRFTNHHANYFDSKGNLLPFGEKNCPPDPNVILQIPRTLSKMIELAEKISCNHPFLRVDFYTIGESIYFGEMTFFPASGLGQFTTDEWDYKIGEMLKLESNEDNN